jgi:copper(I)-binding protein
MRRHRVVRAAGVVSAVSWLAIASACSADSSEFAATAAWSRPTPANSDTGVVYLTLTTDADDALVAASVDDTVAKSIEMHATTVDSGSGAHTHGGGSADVYSMGSVERFDLSASESLVFQPGGNHLMLIDLAAPLKLGSQFELALEFASGRDLVVDVIVADNPPG